MANKPLSGTFSTPRTPRTTSGTIGNFRELQDTFAYKEFEQLINQVFRS